MTKNVPNKVLIALDFEEHSLLAFNEGVQFFQAAGSEVTLLHVVEYSGLIAKHFSPSQLVSVQKDVDGKLEEYIRPFVKKSKVSMTALAQTGKVYEKILDCAERLNVSLIVMGCRSASSNWHQFIGSNTLHVIRTSPIPVLTIKAKPHRAECKTIVLPLDLTKETREKVVHTIAIANQHNAVVRVMSVAFTKDEFVVNRLTRQLLEVKAAFERAGIHCTGELVKGIKGEENLAECIVDYADKVDGDLLVIMTQQEVDPTDYFIGSSAQEIILKADMPVLTIIPAPSKKRTKNKARKKS